MTRSAPTVAVATGVPADRCARAVKRLYGGRSLRHRRGTDKPGRAKGPEAITPEVTQPNLYRPASIFFLLAT